MAFKFEDYDDYEKDQFAGYAKKNIIDYVDRPFIIEKAEIADDVNGEMLRLGVTILETKEKVLFYTASGRLKETIHNILEEEGVIPLIPVKIVSYKYPKMINPGYKFETVE